jgi:hypothetical protein
MKSIGIDYGMGTTNVDTSNGIRYGVISQHSLGESWYDGAEAQYGEASCPECGGTAVEYSEETHGEYGLYHPYRRRGKAYRRGCQAFTCRARRV